MKIVHSFELSLNPEPWLLSDVVLLRHYSISGSNSHTNTTGFKNVIKLTVKAKGQNSAVSEKRSVLTLGSAACRNRVKLKKIQY